MYTLSCKDMGSTDCDFVASADSREEVKRLMIEHAKSAHPEKMSTMTEEEITGMGPMMDNLIKEV